MGALAYQVLDSDDGGLHKTQVVVTGGNETAVVDAGFRLSDGRRVAQAATAAGGAVSLVMVSGGDPDFYFGLQSVRAAFPEAAIRSTGAIIEHIDGTYRGKLKTWAAQLGEELPTDVIIPDPLTGSGFTVDGRRFEVAGETAELPDHIYLWQPDDRAILGGVFLFDGLHVWTADTPRPEQRAAWRAQLEDMLDRQPRFVVAGHRADGGSTDAGVIAYTLQYLNDFEAAVTDADDAAAAQREMRLKYPGRGFDLALDIGARVAKGEMAWG